MEMLDQGCELKAEIVNRPEDKAFGWALRCCGNAFLCKMGVGQLFYLMADHVKKERSPKMEYVDIISELMIEVGEMCGVKLKDVGRCQGVINFSDNEEEATDNEDDEYKEI